MSEAGQTSLAKLALHALAHLGRQNWKLRFGVGPSSPHPIHSGRIREARISGVEIFGDLPSSAPFVRRETARAVRQVGAPFQFRKRISNAELLHSRTFWTFCSTPPVPCSGVLQRLVSPPPAASNRGDSRRPTQRRRRPPRDVPDLLPLTLSRRRPASSLQLTL